MSCNQGPYAYQYQSPNTVRQGVMSLSHNVNTADGKRLSSSGSSAAAISELDCSGTESESSEEPGSGSASGSGSDVGAHLPYPGFADVALRYLTQDTTPRNWCLKLITNPWFERISMLVILLNCVTLGMYQPCVDKDCQTNRCKILEKFDDFIFAFFSLEMTIKMVAMGVYGKGTYLADSWNRLDFFIVLAGALEYCLHVESLNLTAIRTIRVLRPLRAINRIPSMRILVMLLLDTLPMLGNVLLLCFFVFFIFGIVGVQLWEGILRQRCVLKLPPLVVGPKDLTEEYKIRVRGNSLSFYYELNNEQDYICSRPEDSGMHPCSAIPPTMIGNFTCNLTATPSVVISPTDVPCVNWNQYYSNCTQLGKNPFQGTISFDNIGLAWVAIFLVISLEGWTDIMYYVQDAHSFWDWVYFVLLIVIGSFFMINLCLVVIATQFAETKKREMERMRQERARFNSTSTLASSTNNSEPTTCYAEIVKYIAHVWRRWKRRAIKRVRLYKYRRQQLKEQSLLDKPGEATQTPRITQHHPCCPRLRQMTQNSLAPITTPALQEVIQVLCPHQDIPSARASPEGSEVDHPASPRRPGLLRVPSISAADVESAPGSGLLSPPSLGTRRRSSVMFSDVVLLHGPTAGSPGSGGSNLLLPGPFPAEKNVCSSEKMTQTGDGNIYQVALPQQPVPASQTNMAVECSDVSIGDTTMTCQELLAWSGGALGAGLPTGQVALNSFFNSLSKGPVKRRYVGNQANEAEDFSCCGDMQQCDNTTLDKLDKRKHSRTYATTFRIVKSLVSGNEYLQKHVKRLVEHKYFQQGILLAILINTLSMGIEYHEQPDWMTISVEISNIVFSAIFAVEMVLKIIAEGPFGYISNGFNVFDGVIVVLSVVELCQTHSGEGRGGESGNSGLSVLRTFRLLRILKLVRFMPNLRRQLFVMLRTMDNVAVFFSLLVLFIFIFSILGMYLFGGKFCKYVEDSGRERECDCKEIVEKDPRCECDRKHFNNILWATVTVFQILTQEDWNVVLFNGMEKTSHWAALYFVALMTFGNYVLFNLLVAILVEGFSSERNERREREQRELARAKFPGERYSDEPSYEESNSVSESSDSFTQEIKNTWRSAEELRKIKDSNGHRDHKKFEFDKPCEKKQFSDHKKHTKPLYCAADSEEPKCNIQKESKMLAQPPSVVERCRGLPTITHTAATPQDSPNTTLETGVSLRDFRYETAQSSLIDSMDSIDRTSCSSIPGLLKPPSPSCISTLAPSPTSLRVEKLPLNLQGEKIIEKPPFNEKSATASNEKQASNNNNCSSNEKNDTKSNINDNKKGQTNGNCSSGDKSSASPCVTNINEKCKIQRNYSWKISRPSLRRKNSKSKNRSGSDSDTIMVLNNGRDHSHCNGSSPIFLAGRNNDVLLQSTNRIQNDTQGDTPNNKSAKGLSPQNSLRSRPYSSVPQMGWGAGHVTRQNSLTTSQIPNLSHIKQSCSNVPSPNKFECRYPSRRNSAAPDYLVPPDNNNDKPINISAINRSNILIASINEKEVIPIPILKDLQDEYNTTQVAGDNNENGSISNERKSKSKLKKLFSLFEPTGRLKGREDYSLYIFPKHNRFRNLCFWFVDQKWFDNVVLLFIALNCITLAMERPNIPSDSTERMFLIIANNVFTAVFALEMFVKVVAAGMFYGPDAYFTSGWNIMDGSLVVISIIDLLMSLMSESSPRIFGILRVFRLLRSLRPLRVINRAPGLKLVVQTLLSSLRPIGNIVLICCTFFIIFGILGVQLFKGAFHYCEGNITGVINRTDCEAIPGNKWANQKYNFDDLGNALMSLFVLSSRDGWVNIMYTGLDAVGPNMQPIVNHQEWRLLYFIAFILLVGFFVLNMFVGVVVENFHRCREEQEKEERVRRAAKRALQMEKKRRKMHEPPYYINYSQARLFVHNVVTSKYFDLAIAAVIGLNVVTMAMEYYKMPLALEYALKIFNYFFTAVFILEAIMKLVALGVKIYMKDKWNQLDVGIVILSIIGIVLEELESNIIPINPTIIRVMRVLRIARVLKLLKMAKGIRALLDTVMQALPQVGNLGLLFFLLFFIFAALGVELFGRLECSDAFPCQGLGEHAHFANFGMAFLTLFRVATGDNWNGIMKDTLREDCDHGSDCFRNCCISTVIAPIFFVIFVLMAQFVLVNVVVAVLMKHLEESHKQMEDEMEMETELERELEKEQEDEEDQALCLALQLDSETAQPRRPLAKVLSLPANFMYSPPTPRMQQPPPLSVYSEQRRQSISPARSQRRQTLHSQQTLGLPIRLNTPLAYANIYEEQTCGEDEPYYSRNRMRCEPENRLFPSDNIINKDILYEESIPDEDKRDMFPMMSTDGSTGLTVKKVYKKSSPKLEKTKSYEDPGYKQRNELQLFHQSCSQDQGTSASAMVNTSFLLVPKPPRPVQKMYGSTKHLFKQAALEYDDVEESCLLLPASNSDSTTRNSTLPKPKQSESKNNLSPLLTSDGNLQPINTSESAESLRRVINERRRMDIVHRDSEDADTESLKDNNGSGQSSEWLIDQRTDSTQVVKSESNPSIPGDLTG